MIHIFKGDSASVLERRHSFGRYTFLQHIDDAGDVDLVVSDMRETSGREMQELAFRAPVVSLDDLEAGKDLSYISIYTLTDVRETSGNFNGPDYLVLGRELLRLSPKPFSQKKGVVISFGGSDPYNLTQYFSSLLSPLGIWPKIILGPLFSHPTEGLEGEIFRNPDNFYDLINGAQVLLTSFGLSMYEAFYLKTPVILFNHTSYHDYLARSLPVLNLGFRDGDTPKVTGEKFSRYFHDDKLLQEKAEENAGIVDGEGARRVVAIIQQSLHGLRTDCLFHHKSYVALKRTSEYTLMRCRACGDLFLYSIGSNESAYCNRNYFLADYKSQYGKTYIEDRDNIRVLGMKRITFIERLKKKKGLLLDVGCALGFFLEVAHRRGWDVRGIEISPFASEWGRTNLSLDIVTGSFLEVDIQPSSCDVVTLFYVVEHFKHVEKVIEKVHGILKDGGVLAVALPNRGGLSFRFSRKDYLKNHPADHYFHTSVRNLKGF
jgi:hypothetical protein